MKLTASTLKASGKLENSDIYLNITDFNCVCPKCDKLNELDPFDPILKYNPVKKEHIADSFKCVSCGYEDNEKPFKLKNIGIDSIDIDLNSNFEFDIVDYKDNLIGEYNKEKSKKFISIFKETINRKYPKLMIEDNQKVIELEFKTEEEADHLIKFVKLNFLKYPVCKQNKNKERFVYKCIKLYKNNLISVTFELSQKYYYSELSL